jgi:hypothetical protein
MENKKKIRELLDKYLEGLTSTEEEDLLKTYFSEGNVPREFSAEAQWFTNAIRQKPDELAIASLEREMNLWVDKQDNKEKSIRFKLWASGIAAGVVLLIGATFLLKYYQSEKSRDTYQDPQIAYLEAKKVLLFVSQSLNKGTDKLQPVTRIEAGSNEMSIFSTFGSGLKNLELMSNYQEESIK